MIALVAAGGVLLVWLLWRARRLPAGAVRAARSGAALASWHRGW
jgi:hypothetical protein